MTETRLRGTDKGEVVTEAFVEGVWVEVVTKGAGPAPIADLVTATVNLDGPVVFIGEGSVETAGDFAPKRRGRPPKSAA